MVHSLKRYSSFCLPLFARAGASGLRTNETWNWVKKHSVPVSRYVGKGTFCTEKPRHELQAESEGAEIPSTVRRLGQLSKVKPGIWRE